MDGQSLKRSASYWTKMLAREAGPSRKSGQKVHKICRLGGKRAEKGEGGGGHKGPSTVGGSQILQQGGGGVHGS